MPNSPVLIINIFIEYSQDEYGFTWKYILMNICMNTLFLYLKCLHSYGSFSIYTDSL